MPTASADELQAISRRLMEAGQVKLYRQLAIDIKVACEPVKGAIKSSALANLPHSGGLNQWVAASRVINTLIRSTYTAGVSVRVSLKGHDIRDLDSGSIRKPVFGNRKVWRPQEITSGFASTPLKALRPAVVAACMTAARTTAAEAGFV